MIKRVIQKNIEHWLGKEKIIVLKGARQVGKTTLMKSMKKKMDDLGKSTVYLEADQLDNQAIFFSPDHFIAYLKQYHDFEKDFLYVFIDEIQHIQNTGLFLKNIFDAHKIQLQLIVSGSSSLEITKSTEFLTGRALTFYIPRVSFYEYFQFKYQGQFKKFELIDLKKQWTELETFYQISKTKLEQVLMDYLEFGGYPEVLLHDSGEDKKTILQSIVKTYLEKDIAYFFSIKDVSAFNNLLKIIASDVGSQLNKSSVSNVLDLNHAQVTHYLNILEGTFVCQRIRPYFTNMRSEISKMPKIFMLDPGLMNVVLSSFDHLTHKMDLGPEVENFVSIELLNRFDSNQVHYHRTLAGLEVDFVVEKSFKELIALEVKYRKKPGSLLSMKHFKERYSEKALTQVVLTKDLLELHDEVYHIPVVLLPFLEF